MYFCEFILTHGIRIQSSVLWFWELILWFQSPCLPELALFDQYDLSKDTMVINIIQSYYTSLYTYWLAYLYHPIRKQERCVVLLTDSQKETLCLVWFAWFLDWVPLRSYTIVGLQKTNLFAWKFWKVLIFSQIVNLHAL